jgi:hypothetical protein
MYVLLTLTGFYQHLQRRHKAHARRGDRPQDRSALALIQGRPLRRHSYVQSRLFTGPMENAEELSKSDFVWSLPETGYANWTEKDAKSYHLWEHEFGFPAEDAPAVENEQGGEQKVIVIEDENEDAEDNTVE